MMMNYLPFSVTEIALTPTFVGLMWIMKSISL